MTGWSAFAITVHTPGEELAGHFAVPDPPRLTPRSNVAPSQGVDIVGLKPGGRRTGMALLKWGLVPYWGKAPTGVRGPSTPGPSR